MTEKTLRYTLRIDAAIFQKFCYIAKYEGRSANKELALYIKKLINQFESKHGVIEIKGL